MKITALIENTQRQGRSDLRNEWGLSLHIAHNNKNILFDLGTSGAFIKNATRLGCSIEEVDAAVISHHHVDHGGGLGAFLSANQKARVYLSANPKDCYLQILRVLKRYVGLNKSLFAQYADRIEFINQPTEVFPQVFLINEIQQVYPLPRCNRFLFVKSAGHLALDDFAHELLMVKGINPRKVAPTKYYYLPFFLLIPVTKWLYSQKGMREMFEGHIQHSPVEMKDMYFTLLARGKKYGVDMPIYEGYQKYLEDYFSKL